MQRAGFCLSLRRCRPRIKLKGKEEEQNQVRESKVVDEGEEGRAPVRPEEERKGGERSRERERERRMVASRQPRSIRGAIKRGGNKGVNASVERKKTGPLRGNAGERKRMPRATSFELDTAAAAADAKPAVLTKSIKLPDPVPEIGIERANTLMRNGRIYRYNADSAETCEV